MAARQKALTQPSELLPHPGCPTCGGQDACLAAPSLPADYPACRTPLLATSRARVRELLAWMAATRGLEPEALDTLADRVVERFGRDRMRFSEVFEPSFSLGPAGGEFFRFSYAFPGHREDRPATEEALLGLAEPLGQPVTTHLECMAPAFGDRSVQQPLFGLAAPARGAPLAKLYLQFEPEAGAQALALAGRLTSIGSLTRRFAGRALHLLGIDLGPGGISGVKLYFLEPELDLGRGGGLQDATPLLADLVKRGRHRLRDALIIHRAAGPDDPGLDRPAMIDFGLLANELRWQDLVACPSLGGLAERPQVTALMNRFRLAVRRLSVAPGDAPRINVYYTLTEVETP